jgi:hypothetical protein
MGLCAPLLAAFQFGLEDIERDPILYSATRPDNPIEALQARLDSGRARLDWTAKHGYLPSLLAALRIPAATQTLVFSKTSFQRDHIGPRTPRAIYFGDEIYIGWVQGGDVIEISAQDPRLGAVFYSLAQDRKARPRFVRQNHECLQCHQGSLTRGVPGHIVRSVYTRPDGQPELRAGSFLTDDTSPFKERFGGWYVTGRHGAIRHMGNAYARGSNMDALLDRERGANRPTLAGLVNVQPYLAPGSDIAALMVLQHQVFVHNLITRANYGTRQAVWYDEMLNRELKRPEGHRSESARRRIEAACEPLVRALLFADEARLASPIVGDPAFRKAFEAAGPRDAGGRSLRQLDLKTRLFRYPLSFLIYSDAFLGLPAEAKEYIYGRLARALRGEDFPHLSAADRQALREILRETHPEIARSLQ